MKIAIRKGLNGVAITDHNSIKGGLMAKSFENDNFRVIVGSEITTDRGEVIGLFLSEEIAPGNFGDVIAEIRDQGGLVILPHPFDRLRSTAFHPQSEDIRMIDAVEGSTLVVSSSQTTDSLLNSGESTISRLLRVVMLTSRMKLVGPGST